MVQGGFQFLSLDGMPALSMTVLDATHVSSLTSLKHPISARLLRLMMFHLQVPTDFREHCYRGFLGAMAALTSQSFSHKVPKIQS